MNSTVVTHALNGKAWLVALFCAWKIKQSRQGEYIRKDVDFLHFVRRFNQLFELQCKKVNNLRMLCADLGKEIWMIIKIGRAHV